MTLTVKQIEAVIKKAKSGDIKKALRIPAENKLFLLVQPSGSSSWRYQYQINKRRRTKSHGPYPDITLKQANELQKIDRDLVKNGIDPLDQLQAQPIKQTDQPTFREVGLMWYEMKKNEWRESHQIVVKDRLEKDLFNEIGHLPIDTISIDTMESAIKTVQNRPAFELAAKARRRAAEIFKYGKVKNYCSENPAQDVLVIIPKSPKIKNLPAPVDDLKQLGTMLADFDRYAGRKSTRYALRLAPLLIVRPGELRAAQWSEFDFEAEIWTIPAERMKVDRKHIVPLSRQALKLLKELRLINTGQYLFPNSFVKSRKKRDPYMSENTINQAIHKMGYKGVMVGHGVRTIASTLANNSTKWTVDAVEKQLAHGDPDKVRAAYDRSKNLEERKNMMQWLADEIDKLKVNSLIE